MIKTIVRLVLVSTLMVAAAPAFSGVATQMWRCEMEEDATEKEVLAQAAKWLKAARSMNGGENLQAAVHFPVAVNATDAIDVLFTVTAPSFEEWGRFWDSFAGSPAAELDKQNELTVCPNSVVWETFKLE